MAPTNTITTILVTYPLPTHTLSRLRTHFSTVHYHPHPQPIPKEILPELQLLYTTNLGIAPETGIISFDQIPNVRHIQMVSAGADKASKQAIMNTAKERGVTLGSASGIHVLSIPPWVVGMAVGIWHQFPKMMAIQKVSDLLVFFIFIRYCYIRKYVTLTWYRKRKDGQLVKKLSRIKRYIPLVHSEEGLLDYSCVSAFWLWIL